MEEEDTGFGRLNLTGVIGFSGKVPHSFKVHPDRQHMIFALGCTVVIEEFNTHKQEFLQGHSNNIVCIDVSKNGVFIASGQTTYMGYKIYSDDEMFYCGTSSGDILGINMSSGLLQLVCPEKNKYSLGITAMTPLQNGTIIVGSGAGVIQPFRITNVRDGTRCFPGLEKIKQEQKLSGAVTSIALRGEGHQFYVVTDKCHLYRFNNSDFTYELINTCHAGAVNDIRFPNNCSDLFATCSYQDVRVFSTATQQELLRINIPNMTCYCLDIQADGTAILTGWDDSQIRAFYPETGRLMYAINNAHKKGVTAICSSSSCNRVISGGGEGHLRVWDIKEIRPSKAQLAKACQQRRFKSRMNAGDDAGIPESTFVTVLVAAMHEHTNAVSCIQISKDDRSCISASADSTCIIWCLETFRRRQIIFSNTLFRCICYHPTECQLITSGTDRKIGYWETFDGSLIRQLDGSKSGSVNGMDITADGTRFVTSGDDKIVKVWNYDEGEVTHVGLGHSSPVTRLRISPDHRHVITVSEDGAIYIWDMP